MILVCQLLVLFMLTFRKILYIMSDELNEEVSFQIAGHFYFSNRRSRGYENYYNQP